MLKDFSPAIVIIISDCCLMPSNFSAISWREHVTFWRDNEDDHFVLDQHVYIFLILDD
jgi:hypothetical protein